MYTSFAFDLTNNVRWQRKESIGISQMGIMAVLDFSMNEQNCSYNTKYGARHVVEFQRNLENVAFVNRVTAAHIDVQH